MTSSLKRFEKQMCVVVSTAKEKKNKKKGRKKRDIITEAFREANVCGHKHCKNGGQKEKKMFIGTE